MSEAEESIIAEETGTGEASGTEGEEIEEATDIDINASLLEAMVKRTEILEKVLRGELSVEEAISSLQAVTIPTVGSKRRKKKK